MGDTTVPATPSLRADVYDVVLRPRRSLVRSTALSIVFSAVPLAVALLWVSFPFRGWTVAAAAVLAVVVVVAVAFVRLSTAYIGIDPEGLTIRGVVTPHRRVPRERVHSLVLATTFGASVDRTTRELVAFDAEGMHLFRIRADVWGDRGLEQVVDALGVQVLDEPRPVPARAFAKRFPSSRTWYEQRGAHFFVGGLAAVVVAALLFIETNGLLGA
ncbi:MULTISPECIES: hypothetical protein [unclassified Curtobacterium]|uniref:hypothetical protein n=1 Tax=unclassified Curtobacterium TaxID=257496 RepID=UPI0008DE9D6D|nr:MULTISPECIES: hypothetical protein [unclassified Curtobacterium]OIH93187.1 hypothetical protein BIU92_10150 [Curtobacterium sp. MCBA15_003]OII30098.1 hypothetical protein BIU94_10885 [Curtobacterium sp. MMLR14_006]